MSQGQIKCIHCDRWVDRDHCHVSKICPYCGARMDIPPRPAPANVPDIEDEDREDDVEDTLLSISAIAVAETVFNDDDDSFAQDQDDSFAGGGGGSFGGGGADGSW